MSSTSKWYHTLEDDDLSLLKYIPLISSIKLITLKKYNKKSISIIKKYISFYKIMFQLLKSNYFNNTIKILYTS